MSELLWKPPRAAQELGISVKTLLEHVRAGEIVYVPLGQGTKRPRMAFIPDDVRAFVEQRRRRDASCQSTSRSKARSTTSTSKSEVSDFMARLNKRLEEKRSPTRSL